MEYYIDLDSGIDIEKIVGYPYEIAKNMLSLEIMEKVETYEPRVNVESIDFKGNMEGLLIPIIHFRKSEEQG